MLNDVGSDCSNCARVISKSQISLSASKLRLLGIGLFLPLEGARTETPASPERSRVFFPFLARTPPCGARTTRA
jgi:hypothetical protein